ncbi:MAG: putative response regulator [Bacteroidetes bacterium HLUCCA01]|nr:MAG: putative response regulator [Bacteroidetes bacterium HLUCCA01]
MKPSRLFLIESNPDIRESLQDLLESEGFEVFSCSNLDILFTKTSFRSYDLIIADTDNQCELNQELARRRKNRDIDAPLFVISCYCVLNKEKYYIRHGLDGVVAKPLDFDVFLQQISEITGIV